MAQPSKQICLGAFAGAHGVRGEVKLKSFTEDPRAIFSYGPLLGEKGTSYTLKLVRETKPGFFVARIAEVTDRDVAEGLKGQKLFIARDKLPAPDEDEFYHEDLVGLAALTFEGAPAGKVKAIVNFGAGDLLELMHVPDHKGAVYIAFTKADVPVIDFEAGHVQVVLPMIEEEPETPQG